MQPNTAASGFTLIEMSIVLVIIGLIVGGVLVGQNLIASAQLRAQVTQFEKFNQALNTFRSKYDCYPGDCPNATTFFPGMNYPYGNGDGNGQLNDVFNMTLPNTTGFPDTVDIEPEQFWVHLWEAGLTTCCNPANMQAVSSYVIGQAFPQDKINGYGIGTGVLGSRNGYYWGITTSCVGGSGCACGNPDNYCSLNPYNTGVITPAQAQAFDAKIDDGQATTGNVYAAWVYGGDNLIHPQTYRSSGTYCITNTIPPVYNTASSLTLCSLWINMQGM